MNAFKIIAASVAVTAAGLGSACIGQIIAMGWDAWSSQIVAEIAALAA